METLLQDLRFSFRALLRNPAFALVAISILALGIAATSSVTTVVSAVLLHDLPFPDPSRLLLFEGFKNENGSLESFPSSYLDYRDWQTQTASFKDVGLYSSPTSFNLLAAGELERVDGEVVDSAYFRILGVRPVVGRVFTAQDDSRPGEPRIAVLSHALWERRFGGDPGAIGESLIVDGESYQIVGVMPARFKGLTDRADLWLPLMMSNQIMGDARFLERRGVRWLSVLGRLKPEVALKQAQQEIDALNVRLGKQYPDTNEHMIVQLNSLKQALFGDLRFPLFTLLGASIFVLLIACTTVANLLLARAKARQREISVRHALGATRVRLLRQLLTESLLLAGISCAFGLLLAQWSTGVLVATSSVELQSFVRLGLDPLVVTIIVTLSLACGVGFGLVPGWLGIRASTLREGSSSTGLARHRFQSSLVVTEVAFAVFLLVGAGLLIKGFQRWRQADLGFRPENLLTVRVDLKGERYADPGSMIQVARQFHRRLQAIPGVKSVSIQGPAIPTDGWYGNSFIVEDLLSKTKDGVAYLVFHHVTPGYFENMGIPLIQGRGLSEADTDKSPLVIIISQAMVRKYWPNESPLGKRMKFGKRDPGAPWFTVIGVVGDLNQSFMQDSEWPGPDVYFSIFQFPPVLTPQLAFLIRPTSVPALALSSPVVSELREVAPDLPPYDVDTMESRLDRFAAKDRFLVLVMSLYAGIALILAAAGLYGVLFYSVTQRTRELGIRVALGAEAQDLLRLVLGRAAALTALGLAIGLGAALGLNRLFERLLYGISPTDARTFLGTSLLLFLISMAAALFPARRAMKIPPTIVLRME